MCKNPHFWKYVHLVLVPFLSFLEGVRLVFSLFSLVPLAAALHFLENSGKYL
jgi:hypothetical protein